uniref:Uncharacterized protein n=1 Tax=Panagrolaimus sp. ES5 TaxID=591445 RepID=A0AC34F469_9BILA
MEVLTVNPRINFSEREPSEEIIIKSSLNKSVICHPASSDNFQEFQQNPVFSPGINKIVFTLRNKFCQTEPAKLFTLEELSFTEARDERGPTDLLSKRSIPLYCVYEDLVFYVRDKQIRRLDLVAKKDVANCQVKPNRIMQPYYSFHYNPSKNSFLLFTRPHNAENNTYDLYKVKKDDTFGGGDVEERTRLLKDAGQTSLAYLTATTHGLSDQAEKLRTQLEEANLPIPEIDPNARL